MSINFPGDKTRKWRDQEADGMSHLFWLAEAAHGNLFQQPLLLIFT